MIGESIAVGHAVNIDGNVYINCDNTFMPANDYIVGCGIVLVGGIDIFIGYTPEAYGMRRILTQIGRASCRERVLRLV